MMGTTLKKATGLLQKSKEKLLGFITGEEDALVVGWFDVFQMLIFTTLCFALLGPFPDYFYTFIHNAPVGWYDDADLNTCDALYNFWKYILYVALGAVLVYIINYANVKKGEG